MPHSAVSHLAVFTRSIFLTRSAASASGTASARSVYPTAPTTSRATASHVVATAATTATICVRATAHRFALTASHAMGVGAHPQMSLQVAARAHYGAPRVGIGAHDFVLLESRRAARDEPVGEPQRIGHGGQELFRDPHPVFGLDGCCRPRAPRYTKINPSIIMEREIGKINRSKNWV